MTTFLILTVLGALITAFQFRKGGIYRPLVEDVVKTPAHTPVSPEIIPETINATTLPTTPLQSQSGAPSAVSTPPALDFSTQKAAYHSFRVLCDQLDVRTDDKNKLCAMVYQESEFKKGAIGKPNKNGTIDYGLCQFNNGTLKGVPLWIGKGATFKDIDEVLNNPEKCARVMIKTCLAGHWNWWCSFGSGAYLKWLSPNSPMWLLAKA